MLVWSWLWEETCWKCTVVLIAKNIDFFCFHVFFEKQMAKNIGKHLCFIKNYSYWKVCWKNYETCTVSSFLNKLLFWSWPQEKMPQTPAKNLPKNVETRPRKHQTLPKHFFGAAPQERLPKKCHIESHIYIFIYFYKYLLDVIYIYYINYSRARLTLILSSFSNLYTANSLPLRSYFSNPQYWV